MGESKFPKRSTASAMGPPGRKLSFPAGHEPSTGQPIAVSLLCRRQRRPQLAFGSFIVTFDSRLSTYKKKLQ